MQSRFLKQFIYGVLYLGILSGLSYGVYAFVVRQPNCTDGRQNQGESGIDCGGPCTSCELRQLKPIEIRSARVFTAEQAKHAKTIVLSEKELFISFGWKNDLFGKHRWDVPLPIGTGYGMLMALGYYVIGKIQKQHPPYFKENIERYCKEASKVFGEGIGVVVG